MQSFVSEKGNPVRLFNPIFLQHDNHICKYIGIEVVLGKVFFEKKPASCEYQFVKIVNKHQRLVLDKEKINNRIFTLEMKYAVSEDTYIRVNDLLEELF